MLHKDPEFYSHFDDLDDQELVKLAQQGEVDAFSTLYERHLPSVYNRVRYVIPERDVEDVTQEIFIAAMKSLKSFRQEALFTTWLRTITNRSVADYYRSRERTKGHLFIDKDLTEMNPSMTQNPINPKNKTSMDDRVLLRQGLRLLPEHYREVILLRFAEGLQFSEIAEELDQSLEATKSLFRRAIAFFKKQLEDSHD